MRAELAHALDACEAEVLAFIEPLEQVGAGHACCGALQNLDAVQGGRMCVLSTCPRSALARRS